MNTTLETDELHRLLNELRPEWELATATATPSEAGQHAIYRLTVETPAGTRKCYLKATPSGSDSTIDLEARILAVLDAHTTLPVPTVYGALDARDELPAPAVLLEAMDGRSQSRIEPAALSERTHRRIARQTGRHLGELHALDAVDGFGFLTPDGPDLRGEQPSGDTETVTVVDPRTDWRACLREWTDGTIGGLRETRFADLMPTARQRMDDEIAALTGPFEPSLARIDNSLENVLLAEGSLTAMLDWEFAMAATPAYDVVHTAASLAGGPFVFAPSVTDRREQVFEAVLAGYGERDLGATESQIRANRECYETLFALRAMANLPGWYRMVDLEAAVDDAAARLRTEIDDAAAAPETEGER